MPSRAKSRLCIFGDSHIASAKRALDHGLLDLPDHEIEFWGATGPAFRAFSVKDGVLVAGPKARAVAMTVSSRARETLAMDEVDIVMFYGARLRMVQFFAPYIQRVRCGTGWPSAAVLQAAARTFLMSTRAYRDAAELAAQGKAKIMFLPGYLPNAEIFPFDHYPDYISGNPLAVEAAEADRSYLWSTFVNLAAADGVILVPQPEDTVVNGIFTKAEFAAAGAKENGDPGHKSPEFAAMMIHLALGKSQDAGNKAA